ncbi:MAG: hypothetical protein IIA85_00395 [Nanoarchaeota archaeon]|nr:hypothetical protein [Nanoarchaeota archaeon]
MKIIGFNFNKIFVEKKSGEFKGVRISNNVDILSVEQIKNQVITQKEELVGVGFKFTVDYGEDIAKIELGGLVILALDSKEAKEVLKGWKDKKLSNEFKIPLFNIILKKSNIKALVLADELNLPSHMKLPSLKIEDKE